VSKPPVLRLSQEDFEALHRIVDKVRAGSKNTSVPVDAVKALLVDHGVLLRHLKVEA